MNFSPSAIAAGLLFGVAGLYFLRYGRKRSNRWSMVIGGAMLIFPYFIESAGLTWLLGAILFVTAWSTR